MQDACSVTEPPLVDVRSRMGCLVLTVRFVATAKGSVRATSRPSNNAGAARGTSFEERDLRITGSIYRAGTSDLGS